MPTAILENQPLPVGNQARTEIRKQLRDAIRDLRRTAHFAHDEYQTRTEQRLYAMAREIET
jgi:hypothetical protein